MSQAGSLLDLTLNLDLLVCAYSASFRFQPDSYEIRHVQDISTYDVGYQAHGNRGRDHRHCELFQMRAKPLL